MADNVPNVFISDSGEMILLDVEEMDEFTRMHLNMCNEYCNHITGKYGTSDIETMLKVGITRKEIIHYIDARHDMIEEGYD